MGFLIAIGYTYEKTTEWKSRVVLLPLQKSRYSITKEKRKLGRFSKILQMIKRAMYVRVEVTNFYCFIVVKSDINQTLG